MKITILILLSMLAVRAEEVSRNWTNAKGVSIFGRLVSKNGNDCVIALDKTGKNVNVKVDALSEDDQKYIHAAKINRIPQFKVVTSTAISNAAGTQKDERAVLISLAEVGTRDCTVIIFWLGDGSKAGSYGLWKTESHKVDGDGSFNMSTIYSGSSGSFGHNYKGFACGLKDDVSGKWIGKVASMKEYEIKYLTD